MRSYQVSIDIIDRFSHSLWNYKAFPKKHWKRIRTTNSLERINKELKRRSRVVGAFPNDASLLRLAVSILIDVNEEWITGRKVFIDGRGIGYEGYRAYQIGDTPEPSIHPLRIARSHELRGVEK